MTLLEKLQTELAIEREWMKALQIDPPKVGVRTAYPWTDADLMEARITGDRTPPV
jgi:hypothetical protein